MAGGVNGNSRYRRKPLMWDIWDGLLTEQDRAVIVEAGYDQQGATLWDSRQLGQRPALLLIDMQVMFIGPNLPILEAIHEYRTAMGSIAWRAMRHIVPFVNAVRDGGYPIIYTRVIPKNKAAEDPALQIIEPLKPKPGDMVFDKPYTSAFFDTDLFAYLSRADIDTLIIAGNSTSGCVRAAVVDARQRGFHPLVPVECVFDRIEASHRIALLDIWMKYATLMPMGQVLNYLRVLAGKQNGN
jgi:maleamate amidohydrolase